MARDAAVQDVDNNVCGQEEARCRVRYTSSPRDTPRAGAEQVATPALTPIALSHFLLPTTLDHLPRPPSLVELQPKIHIKVQRLKAATAAFTFQTLWVSDAKVIKIA